MLSITPFLMYASGAADAARFYVSLFDNSRIVEQSTRPGSDEVTAVVFELDGRPYNALNGGDHFQFSDSFSLSVLCETQAEVDRLWQALSDGGTPMPCGWLADRWGLRWQIVPQRLFTLLNDPDPRKAERVMHAILQMSKIDVAQLERAHAGEA